MTDYATGGIIPPGTTPRDIEEPRGVVRPANVREGFTDPCPEQPPHAPVE